MIEDAPLFQPHSETSRAAWLESRPTAAVLRGVILAYIESRGENGATDEEIQAALMMPGNTERPRRVELVEGGWVRDVGARRATRAGRRAVVWVAKGGGE